MRQDLTTDTVERYIEASPDALYDFIADVTRTPELTPDVVRITWLDGATEPKVGARFKARNSVGYGPKWNNHSVFVTVEPGREIAWQRIEMAGGVVEWRWKFAAEGAGTRVTESYLVTKPVPLFGWFIIGTVFRRKDRRADLRKSMEASLTRLAELVGAPASAGLD